MSSEQFNCIICFQIARTPVYCQGCKMMYCQSCLQQFWAPNTSKCISCEGQNIVPLPLEFQIDYENVRNKLKPNKPFVPLPDSGTPNPQMMEIEKLGPCQNYQLCKSNIQRPYDKEGVCGPECLIYYIVSPLKETNQVEKMRSEIQRCIGLINEKKNQFPGSIPQLVPYNSQQQRQNVGVTNFLFDVHSPSIKVTGGKVILTEEVYVFRSIVSGTGFTNGIHYWEISPDISTENEMKIGVSKSKTFDLNSGFSDYQFGFAYYTVGQLRNGSNSNGKQFGVRFKNKGVLGILLDMSKGRIAFCYDGQYLGIGFESKDLTIGPIFPAVAMLHKAGFEYKTGIGIPQQIATAYFKQ